MIVSPHMLVSVAREAGMKVPPDPDKFPKEEYPHFQVFCESQLGPPLNLSEHWENARIIAAVPDDEIKKITLEGLKARGFRYGS